MLGFALYHVASVGFIAASLVIRRSGRPYHGLWGFASAALGSGFIAGMFYRDWALDPFFAALRCWAWAIFCYGPILLGAYAVLERRRRPGLAGGCGLLALLLVGVGIDAFFIEPTALQVRRFEVTTDKVNKPFTIAVLADLQTDTIGDYEHEVARRTMAEKPDMILMPGDFIQPEGYDYEHHGEPFRAWLKPLSAPLGVFAVGGNVEQERPWVQALFEGTHVPATESTRTHRLDGITVTALSLRDSFDPQLTLSDQPGFHIVFGHGPDFALGSVHADLLVAGHTHGGQVQLPWIGPLVTLSKIPRAWADGLTRLSDGRTLVVSRGIGHEQGNAPRLRFLCRPEVVLIDVVPRGKEPG